MSENAQVEVEAHVRYVTLKKKD